MYNKVHEIKDKNATCEMDILHTRNKKLVNKQLTMSENRK
jgi:hypothetical protein